MARRIVEVLTDDIEGGEAAETIRFALDGVNYEIDLNDANAARLRGDLLRFVDASRRIGGGLRPGDRRPRRTATSARVATDRAQNKVIREWAARAGIPVNNRGRIPQEVVDRFWAVQNADRRAR